MKYPPILTARIAILFILINLNAAAQTGINREILFDSGWKFHKGGAQGAESPSFDDSAWRKVDLPHDWSIEDLPGTGSPFNKDAISQVSGGFTTGGTGWYRKSFSVQPQSQNRRYIILFEGVYMNSEVWINDEYLGDHPYGYTSFWFDISDKIKEGKSNLLAVKVKNEGENSRWYSGSGIYRHVWLLSLPSVYFKPWGINITSKITDEKNAGVNVSAVITNSSDKTADFSLVTSIFDWNGALIKKTETGFSLEPGKSADEKQDLNIVDPLLWSTDSPSMYKAVSELVESGVVTDRVETSFGIRSISFDAVNGFRLNNKPLKLKGGCVHNDNGIIGSRAYDRAEERRVELLKSAGFNAIRSAHNPPSPAFLDACDRNGMLVIDESFDMWNEGKNPSDYHLYFNDWWKKDIESMIMRDRNHPSVIMWSIGNEIPDRENPMVISIAKSLGDYVRSLDPGRPVTSAVNNLSSKQDPFFATLDVAGYNYASGGDHNQENIYEADHVRLPGRIMVGTESYPLEAFSSWMDVLDHPYVTGDFVWTSFDYIGEASIGWRGYYQKQDFFPWNLAFCGDLDICGWKRPQSYYRDALWSKNKLSIWVKPPSPSFELNPQRESWSKWHWIDALADWTWPGNEGKLTEITVYSSCPEVELFLNGKSLGKKITDRSTKFMGIWDIPYQPGTLKAVGTDGHKKVAEAELVTASQAESIKLSADRQIINANGEDLSYVTIELNDKAGNLDPKAVNLLKFDIDGQGTIIGSGNGNPVSTESFQKMERQVWRGKCLLVIKSGTVAGKIKLKVTSPGLQSGMLEIESR